MIWSLGFSSFFSQIQVFMDPNSSGFHAIPCMEANDPHDSIRFHAWNHDLQTFHAIPRMESYDSIHGSA